MPPKNEQEEKTTKTRLKKHQTSSENTKNVNTKVSLAEGPMSNTIMMNQHNV